MGRKKRSNPFWTEGDLAYLTEINDGPTYEKYPYLTVVARVASVGTRWVTLYSGGNEYKVHALRPGNWRWSRKSSLWRLVQQCGLAIAEEAGRETVDFARLHRWYCALWAALEEVQV